MHYSTLLVAALAVVSSVSAKPAEAADRDRDRDRGDRDSGRYEPFVRGECRDSGDDLYCGRSINEFCRYDSRNRYCFDDNINKVFCAYRNQQEFARQFAEEWGRVERCGRDEYWDTRERRCECYRRRRNVKSRDDRDRGDRDRECERRRGNDGDRDGDRDGGRDGDRGGDRDGDRDGDRGGDRGDRDDAPNCKNGQIAFCARSENEIITYERDNVLCERRDGNYVFCASTERGKARDKARDHFRNNRNV